MKCGFLLDIVVGDRSSILKLFPSKNQSLLKHWNLFSSTDQPSDTFDAAVWRDLYSDSSACQCLDKDLHPRLVFDEVEEI